MILTVALNPSVVRNITLDEYNEGKFNLAKEDNLTIGDCGIYSAYVIKVMQGEPYVMGISGGIGGRFIKNYLDRNHIKTDFLQVHHEAKSYIIIKNSKENNLMKILSHNEDITKGNFINIKHKINHHIDKTSIIVISGSDNHLGRILDEIHSLSKDTKKIIIGATGPVIKECCNKSIYGAVFLKSELKYLEIDGLTDEYTSENLERIKGFQKKHKIKYLIIQGEEEIYGITKNKICKINYKKQEGDYPIVKSMILGGLAIGIRRNHTIERTMKLIGSIANGANISEYPYVISRKAIDKGLKQVKIIDVYNNKNGYLSNKNGQI